MTLDDARAEVRDHYVACCDASRSLLIAARVLAEASGPCAECWHCGEVTFSKSPDGRGTHPCCMTLSSPSDDFWVLCKETGGGCRAFTPIARDRERNQP